MSDLRPPLPDQAARDRFCAELETNFSVIAPAGVGKTTGIVARVVAIAEADRLRPDDPILPKLVVVTYTKKAADEMFGRVRAALDERLPHPEVHAHLAQAFFGTIHSFCQRLLVLAGPLLGLPGEAAIATSGERLWRRFRREETLPAKIPAEGTHAFALFGQWSDVFALAENWPGGAPAPAWPGRVPEVDGDAILALRPKGSGAANLLASQEKFRRWQAAVEREQTQTEPRPCPLPEPQGEAKPLVAAWTETFRPLHRWRASATGYLAGQVATAFAQYRRRVGELTFDDLIVLARQLMEEPASADRLRARDWRVILDEAQDTDPDQFFVLSELTRPVGAQGDWLEEPGEGPRAGHFCMVGDMQQSIYSDRADLPRYQRMHRGLLAAGGAEVVFSVTMRCPVRVVEFLNATFPAVLREGGSGSEQVPYVRLEHPDGAATGQVVRWSLPPPGPDVPKQAAGRLREYAREFARWWKTLTPAALGARDWGEVAILCGRNGWLDRLASALEVEGVPVHRASRRTVKAEDPTWAWYAAVLGVCARPRDGFELYGILRDVLGHSDDALARYAKDRRAATGERQPFRIDRAADGNSAVARSLSALARLRAEVLALPLYEAVERLLSGLALEARLVASGLVEPVAASRTLSALRQATAQAEAEQLSLVEWADRCRDSLVERVEESGAHPGAVVLLSAHKSKGLGFRAVVLPTFFRGLGERSPSYPRCERAREGGVPALYFSKADLDDEQKEARNRRRREVHERLLYVALTRVKHTLILLDDFAWWSEGRARDAAFGDLLQTSEAEPNGAPWRALPETLEAVDPASETTTEAAEMAATATADCSPKLAPSAASAADPAPKGWRRVTPSSLQVHDTPAASGRDEPDRFTHPEFPEEGRPRDPAAYGNWWHNMMETAPWGVGPEALAVYCQDKLKLCPSEQMARGVDEVARFLKSDLAATLTSPAWEVWCEVPFLSGNPAAQIGYEGYIDLMARERTTGEWLVVDWKTDRMPGTDLGPALLAAYGPQLTVYAEALLAATTHPTRSGLYSTVLATWLEG